MTGMFLGVTEDLEFGGVGLFGTRATESNHRCGFTYSGADPFPLLPDPDLGDQIIPDPDPSFFYLIKKKTFCKNGISYLI